MNWLKRMYTLVAVAVVACASTTGPAYDESWKSVLWSYSFKGTAVEEGMSGVAGEMVFERRGNEARVGSDRDVLAELWATEGGVDTLRGVQRVWPAGVWIRGLVSVGDTFHFQEATEPNAWPVYGEYVLKGDTLEWNWDRTNENGVLHLGIKYVRR